MVSYISKNSRIHLDKNKTMIIAFAIIALIIISGLSIGIYAIFIPFMQNVSSIQAYNSAYYGAIAATERALLVAKQQEFWFNGSWWRKWTNQRWPISDYSNWSMGILAEENNGIQREVIGKTMRIPQEWKWDIPQLFSATDSNNFNSFTSQDTIIIHTETNNNSDANTFYAQTSSNEQPNRSFIATQWRVPPYIQDQQEESTAMLCDTYNPICNTNTEIDDDTNIFRQRKWLYNNQEFSIIPTTQIFRTPGTTYVGDEDMHIRESIINQNNSPTIQFTNTYNPIPTNVDTTTHTTLWPWGDDIKDIVFTDIFNTPEIEGLYLQYSMAQQPISRAWFIYPFLEYAIISDAEISDTHRHIQGKSTVGNYEVKIQIDKPQNEQTQGSNFTIIF